MATGRSEMLRKNQERARKNRQKKAKKTETLAQKAAKAKVDTKKAFSGKALMGGSGSVKGQGPVKSGKTYGELLKKNKKEDAGGPKGVLAPTPMKKKAPTPPKKSATTPPKKKPASAQSNNDGTYGKSMPSNPAVGITMKPRQRRPGTGRTGQAAALGARRDQNKPKNVHKKTMTAAERRAARLRARRGR